MGECVCWPNIAMVSASSVVLIQCPFSCPLYCLFILYFNFLKLWRILFSFFFNGHTHTHCSVIWNIKLIIPVSYFIQCIHACMIYTLQNRWRFNFTTFSQSNWKMYSSAMANAYISKLLSGNIFNWLHFVRHAYFSCSEFLSSPNN